MKLKIKISFMLMLVSILCVCNVQAAIYNIEPGDNVDFLYLIDNDSLVMTGGEIDWLDLDDWSVATIENTEPITDTETGGIWTVDMGDYSTFNLEGGEINFIEAWGESTINMTGGYLNYIVTSGESKAYLSGGIIDDLWRMPLENGAPIEEAMIHVFALDYLYDLPGNLLTGHCGLTPKNCTIVN